MQITPIPVPVLPNLVPQDVAARTAAAVQAQAASPVIQRAIDPAPKSNNGSRTRSNGDRAKGGDKSGSGGSGGKSGGAVNIRV